jgi:hypothetical protein
VIGSPQANRAGQFARQPAFWLLADKLKCGKRSVLTS